MGTWWMRTTAGVGLLALGACGGGGEDSNESEVVTRRFADVFQVVVSASEGDVTLIAEGANGQVQVDALLANDDGSFQAESINGRLVVGSVCRDGARGCGTGFTLRLPESTEFEILTESGNVRIEGMSLLGTITTTVGDVEGVDLKALTLTTTTLTSGQQDLAFELIPAAVTMDGGDTGNLTIRLPPNGDYQFDTQTTTGNISFENGLDSSPFGPLISMQTRSGDILVTTND